MTYSITLPKNETGPVIDCNKEAGLFIGERIVPLWTAFNLILSGPIHSPSECKFLDSWLSDGFLDAETKAKMVAQNNIGADGVTSRFKEILRKQRPQLKEVTERVTLYKHYFAAALHSERTLEQVVSMLDTAREVLEIEMLTGTLISDALTSALPQFNYEISKLTQEEREIILAIIFIALNADNQKHILELNACRVIMAALSLTAVNNLKLGEFTRKSIQELFRALSPSAQLVALLNTLRMVMIDGNVQDDEKKLVRSMTTLLPPDQVKALIRVAHLEYGKLFQF